MEYCRNRASQSSIRKISVEKALFSQWLLDNAVVLHCRRFILLWRKNVKEELQLRSSQRLEVL